MWPDIKKRNGIGVKFQEDFWDDWGPTQMFYFNPELFNDEKSIKSIYCIYLPHQQIEFNPDETAMGLHYQCGDFGEHTVLFSYEEIPNLKYSTVWKNCVFSDLETDNDNYINLYNYEILKKQGKMSEEDIYKNYLEDDILGSSSYKTFFRDLSRNIINAFMKNNPSVTYEQAYMRFIENLAQRISEYENSYALKKKLRETIEKFPKDFDKTILEIVKSTRNKR